MNLLLAFFTALAINMALIPVMIRLAPRLGMVDLPEPRKVHVRPVPRIGGIGIAVGALVAIALWVPMDHALVAYLGGSLVLLLFGAWDDSRELGHYVKFLGQFIAVVPLVYWADLWVSSFPFLSSPLPEAVGKPFTVFAMVGMINAINHSDGLDGLAGGESLLSLACLAYLGYTENGSIVVMMAAAIIGGLFGFLRFNTHPAQVFMGDSGSQFLGFSLGVLTVLLTQRINPNLSMALPALILGLPIIDILAVFAQRVYHGMNWFRASKNHTHHRLLALGFDHYQAVVIIYSIQAFFVVSAALFLYEKDAVVVSLYLAVSGVVFALLALAERRGWRANAHVKVSVLATMMEALKSHPALGKAPILFLQISIPLYLLLGSVSVDRVPLDFGVATVVIAVVLAFWLLLRGTPAAPYLMRAAVFGIAAFLVFLLDHDRALADGLFAHLELAYFMALAIAIALVMRYSSNVDFKTTPLDFLMVFVVIASGLFSRFSSEVGDLGGSVVKGALLFYGIELVISYKNTRWNGVWGASAITAAGILGLRGIMLL